MDTRSTANNTIARRVNKGTYTPHSDEKTRNRRYGWRNAKALRKQGYKRQACMFERYAYENRSV